MTGAARSRWPSMAGPVVAVLAAAGLMTSCGAPHPGLSNGSVSACYRALPVARDAVHTKATLVGVHRVPADRLKAHLPPAAQAVLAGDDDTTVCAVAFKGTFTSAQVDLSPAGEQGRYAVVLITSRHLDLLASAVLTNLPRAFGQRTL
jgi:hypothetical protein